MANAINPFELNTIEIPMKGLKMPFNKFGYWGFRGTFINKFVEKLYKIDTCCVQLFIVKDHK